jgi:hypothetical protein
MTSVEFIKEELKKLHIRFSSSNIRYEFNVYNATHIIEITPLEFYNNETYMASELELEELFLNLYPKESILFVSTDSLNKVSKPIFEIYCEKTGSFTAGFSVSDLISFQKDCDNDYLIAGENNYALAA